MSRSASAAVVLLFSSLVFSQNSKSAASPQTPRQALLEVITAKDSTALRRHLPEATKNYWSAHLSQLPYVLAMGMTEAMASTGNDGAFVALPRSNPALEKFTAGPVLVRKRDASAQVAEELRIDNEDLTGDQDTLDLSLHQNGPEGEVLLPIPAPGITVKMDLEQGIWRFQEIAFTVRMPLGDPAFVKQTMRQDAETTELWVAGALQNVAVAEADYLKRNDGKSFSCSLAELAPPADKSDDVKSLSSSLRFIADKGYRIQLSDCTTTAFHASAVPQQSGQPVFCADQSGIIKKSNKSDADCFAAGEPVREDNADHSSPQ